MRFDPIAVAADISLIRWTVSGVANCAFTDQDLETGNKVVKNEFREDDLAFQHFCEMAHCPLELRTLRFGVIEIIGKESQ